jgi:hypothetical protein
MILHQKNHIRQRIIFRHSNCYDSTTMHIRNRPAFYASCILISLALPVAAHAASAALDVPADSQENPASGLAVRAGFLPLPTRSDAPAIRRATNFHSLKTATVQRRRVVFRSQGATKAAVQPTDDDANKLLLYVFDEVR